MHLVQDAVMGLLTLFLLAILVSCAKFDSFSAAAVGVPTPSASPSPTPTLSVTPSPIPSATPLPTPGTKCYEFSVSQSPEVRRKSDILFVLDNSGSMAGELNAVYDRVLQFTQGLKGRLDFTIRVTTTDDARLGELMTARTGETVLAGTDPLLDQKMREMISAIPFPAYNGVEMGLKGALQALRKFSPGPVTNIIIFSDEDDESPGVFSQYLSAFQDYARTKQTKLSFHPVILTPQSSCGVSLGESYGTRYADMALAFSNNQSKIHDLCRMDLLFSDLATAVTQSASCFTIPAGVTTIHSLSIDNSVIPNSSYSFQSSNNSLCFAASITLRVGSRIRLQYSN